MAERLARLQVPVIVATGHSETDDLPRALRSRPQVRKPYGHEDPRRALAGLAAA